MTDNHTDSSVFLRLAVPNDILALESFLNRCYRFDEGWTNEFELVGGIRTNQDELKSVIADPTQYLFVYPKTDNAQRDGEESGEILGCINVGIHDGSAHIGMFAVHPELQGCGVGNTLLQAAETFAQRHLSTNNSTTDNSSTGAENPTVIKMLVLNGRPKLLAYYQRRGYLSTGNTEPFPEDGNNGEPKKDGLFFLELAKSIS
ncbi:GNAT family N-acetyltransferase [Psychrobacter sp. GP33]|uniref:GNAT family N-acetyltransferase n=1 Tax=Psychrobacter sp. GP33 TaxID=2758709 RepID=UPI0015F8837A|nr:GNAT family N-acetyltransferase [Psychrobacter sp. GP33]